LTLVSTLPAAMTDTESDESFTPGYRPECQVRAVGIAIVL
jgi:hypothetical protein